MTAYVFGAAALDILLKVSRADRVEVFSDETLTRGEIHRMFPVIGDRPIDVLMDEPAFCCPACDVGASAAGLVIDRMTGEPWGSRAISFSLARDPSMACALRHAWLVSTYPEVPIDPVSLRLIRAKVAFAQARSTNDPTHAVLLVAALLETRPV